MEQEQTANILRTHDRIIVATQAHPNGDQFSAALGLTRFLQNLGKKSTLLFDGAIPSAFSFLPYEPSLDPAILEPGDFHIHLELKEDVTTPNLRYEREGKRLTIILSDRERLAQETVRAQHAPLPFDLVITVGCAEKEALGEILAKAPATFSTLPIVNIDHHAENSRFGSINYIDLTTLACSEVISDLLRIVSPPHIDSVVATCLLAGILSATKNFRHPRTTPQSFLRAAALLNHGADREQIARSLWQTQSVEHLKKLASLLRHLEISEPGPFGIITQDETETPFQEESVAELARTGENLLEEVLPTLLALAFVWKKPEGYAAIILSERRHLLEHITKEFTGSLTGHVLIIEKLPEHPKILLSRILSA